MSLSAMLIFDQSPLTVKQETVQRICEMGREVITREAEITTLIDKNFKRIIYLGSGSLAGLTREAQLKVLELTAGQLATVFDSSMGFRHGPKSFVNNQALVFDFLSNQPYTRQYDLDVMEEIKRDDIAAGVITIGAPGRENFSGEAFVYGTAGANKIGDGYLALADIMVAQTVALHCSLSIGNTPDTPSPTGTVNRVVQGVIIHPFVHFD